MNIVDVFQLISAILALIIGLGAYWHSRTNRRVIMKILQRRPTEARAILFLETDERTGDYTPLG